MEGLLLQSKSKKDIAMLEGLAKKIGFKTRHLSPDELEDLGLANAMKKGRTGQYTDTDAYLKKLANDERLPAPCF